MVEVVGRHVNGGSWDAKAENPGVGIGLVGTEDDSSNEGLGFDLVRRVLHRSTSGVASERLRCLSLYINRLRSGGSCFKCSNN